MLIGARETEARRYVMRMIALGALLMKTLPVSASEPLPPVGKWTVEYAASGCVLSRQFGNAAASTAVAFAPAPLAAETNVTVFPNDARATAASASGSLTIEPSGTVVPMTYDSIVSPQTKANGIRIRVGRDARALLDAATAISISTGTRTVSLALPGVAPALAALKLCQDDLLRDWDVDPAVVEKAKTSGTLPKPVNPNGWFGTDEYPAEALAAQAHGPVTTVWTISLDGRVSNCRVVTSSGAPSLDRATCAVSARARFAPAKDDAGTAITGYYLMRMNWVLPGG